MVSSIGPLVDTGMKPSTIEGGFVAVVRSLMGCGVVAVAPLIRLETPPAELVALFVNTPPPPFPPPPLVLIASSTRRICFAPGGTTVSEEAIVEGVSIRLTALRLRLVCKRRPVEMKYI